MWGGFRLLRARKMMLLLASGWCPKFFLCACSLVLGASAVMIPENGFTTRHKAPQTLTAILN